ncbi:MAG: thioredoxin family protein [bacterium]
MNLQELNVWVTREDAVLLYATTTDCSVCKVLKPKVRELLSERFPKIDFVDVEVDVDPDVGRTYEVLSVPTVIAFFAGKEHFRKVRVFGIEELAEAIERPYELMFES